MLIYCSNDFFEMIESFLAFKVEFDDFYKKFII